MSSKLIVDTIEDSTGTYSLALGSGNSTFPGGIHIGGTGSANLLDDYEEGTWTPVVTDGTGSVSISGQYVKVGNIVWVQMTGYNTNYSSIGTGNLQITGFPFVGGGGQQIFPTNDPSNNGPYALEVSGTSTYIWRVRGTATDYYFTQKATLGIGTSGSIRGSIVYRTT